MFGCEEEFAGACAKASDNAKVSIAKTEIMERIFTIDENENEK